MRVTIIPSDGIVIVDGVTKSPIDLSFMSDIHAVQWYDTWGEIERIDAEFRHSNERIDSFSQFEPAVALWHSWVRPPEPPLPNVS